MPEMTLEKSSLFGWTVVIGGSAYEVRRNEAGLEFVRHFAAGLTYQVYCDAGIPIRCTCPDAHYRRRLCKHCLCASRLLGQGDALLAREVPVSKEMFA